MNTADSPGYYRRRSATTFEPTEHVQGAWRDTEQHMAPAAGLLAHALETAYPRADLQLCRISYDILGVIAAELCEVMVEVVRPGRSIELLEARMVIGGRTAIRASGWRLARSDTSAVAGDNATALPEPPAWPRTDIGAIWGGGFIDSLQIHRDPASDADRSRAWLSTPVSLIEGEPVSELAAFTGLVDTANGMAGRAHPRDWLFPNTDLTVHYFRTPRCEGQPWIGLDTAASWGPDGVGLTSTTLYDRHGPVGRSEQILTLRHRGGAEPG